MTQSPSNPSFQKLLQWLKFPAVLEKPEFANDVLNIHVVGMTGTEGTALIELFCKRLGNHVRVTGHDFSSELEQSFHKAHVSLKADARQARFEALMALPQLSTQTGDSYLRGTEKADIVFVGQNWRAYKANSPKLFAIQNKVPFAQMTDLYLELTPCTLIGVTGTNGKTTTCNWLKSIIQQELPTSVSGNDLFSKQALDLVLDMPEEAVLVLEVSNRQARDMHKSPPIAAVTSLAPDHVSEHGSFQGYLEAKRKLVEMQTASDTAILNYDCPWVSSYADHTEAKVLWVSATELPHGLEGGYSNADGELYLRVDGETHHLIHVDELALVGDHNVRNGLTAALGAYKTGVSLTAIIDGLQNFRGVKNRLQRVARVDGINYFNDLASTTPWSTLAALEAFKKPSHIIIGGSVKVKSGYDQLAAKLEELAASIIALPGTVTDEIKAEISDPNLITVVNSIDEAVKVAADRVKTGEQVLLSPAGSGFYSSYLGKFGSFNKSVRRLRKNRVA